MAALVDTHAAMFDRVCSQLEYYLSPENVMHDPYLRSLLSPTGFAPLVRLGGFHRLQLITADLNIMRSAILASPRLLLRVDWNGQEWVGLFPNSHEKSKCTLIVLGVALNAKSDAEMRSICSPSPYHTYQFSTGVWYLTFDDPAMARRAFFALQDAIPSVLPGAQVRIRTDSVDRGFGDNEGPQFQPPPDKGLPGGLVLAALSYQDGFQRAAVAPPYLYPNPVPDAADPPPHNHYASEGSVYPVAGEFGVERDGEATYEQGPFSQQKRGKITAQVDPVDRRQSGGSSRVGERQRRPQPRARKEKGERQQEKEAERSPQTAPTDRPKFRPDDFPTLPDVASRRALPPSALTACESYAEKARRSLS